MHRILFILLLVPIFAVRAATPYLSFAIEPTIILPTHRYDYPDGVEVETIFLTMANNVVIGIRSDKSEWFTRLTLASSHETTDTRNSSYTTDSYRKTARTYQAEHLRQREFSLGGHWVMANGYEGRVQSYLGGGIVVGVSDWYEYIRMTTLTELLEFGEIAHDTIYDKEDRLTSEIDLGVFLELGSTIKLLESLSLDFATQAEVIYVDYGSRGMIIPANNVTSGDYILTEPSFLLGLRWDLRN